MNRIVKNRLILLMLALSSCAQRDELTTRTPANVLHFESNDEFERVMNFVSTASLEDLDEWETNNNFVSYRTEINKAHRQLEMIETEREWKNFLDEYRDILSLKDSLIAPHITVPLYQAVVNREGVYQTGNYVNKLIKNYVLTVEKEKAFLLTDLNGIDNNVNSILNLAAQRDIDFFEYSNDVDSNASVRTNAACSTIEYGSYYFNPSGCKDDRKVFIDAKSYITISRTYEGDWRQPRVSIQVYAGKRKGTFCNWVGYSTTMDRRNISFGIMNWTNQNGVLEPKYYDINVPDESSSYDVTAIGWDYAVGSKALNQLISPSPFTYFYGEASSRGVAGNWAIINCN